MIKIVENAMFSLVALSCTGIEWENMRVSYCSVRDKVKLLQTKVRYIFFSELLSRSLFLVCDKSETTWVVILLGFLKVCQKVL